MSGDRLERLEQYVRDELAPDDQAALELELGSDPELRGLLEEVRAASSLAQQLRASRSLHPPRDMPAVTGYDLERELHRGGQGIVYVATQRSTGRRVAVKVLLAGRASTSRQQQRLEREIDLAASIPHPGVVTVFDRALTDDDRPALVMELIDGLPLDAHLRERQLSGTQTLALVAAICDIVSAAHQRGVIHRDLKPSNILIEGDGRPRVLDFGLAKASGADGPGSLVTHEGEFMGTLAYSGPEQVERGAAAADVRSDVYALGAILGEALTGSLPIDVSGPLAGAIGRIRETPPIAPSSVRSGLDPDIDTIVLTAMAKDPQRRYQSAAELAADIRRFLGDEPILARPASGIYQLRKFARRNRALVAAFIVALVALVSITLAVSVGLVRTNAARAAALVDADKQARMNAFLRDLLASPEPGRSGPDLRVVDLLGGAGQRIEREFMDYPKLQAQLYSTLGGAYWRLGLPDPAQEHMARAVELFQAEDGDAFSPDLPSSLSALGSIAHTRGELDRARDLHEQALAAWAAQRQPDALGVARTRTNLAGVRLAQGEAADAERLYHQALGDLDGPSDAARLLTAQTLVSLGAIYRPQERYDEARAAYERALPILRELRGDEHPDTLACLGNQAEVFARLGDEAQAEARMRELIEIRRRVFGPEHERVGIAINNLADYLRELGRSDEAIELFGQAISIFSGALGERHFRVAMAQHNMGLTMLRAGRTQESLEILTGAAAILSEAVPVGHWIHAQFKLSLGEALLSVGRPREARDLIGAAHLALEREFGRDHSRTLTAVRLSEQADAMLTRVEGSAPDP